MEFKSPAIHRTPLYRAKAAFANMVRRCGNKTSRDPAYANVKVIFTKEAWLAWAVPRYEKFAEDHPTESPSVSRKEDCGDYEIGNVEIAPMSDNRVRQKAKLLMHADGTKLCGGKCKQVKLATDFNRNRTRPDGYDHICRVCRRCKRRTD